MSIERIVNPAVVRRQRAREAELCGAVSDHGPAFQQLRAGRTIFLPGVVNQTLPLGRHLRIELERLKVQFRFDDASEPAKCSLERLEADDAPRANDIRHEVDFYWASHCSAPSPDRRRRGWSDPASRELLKSCAPAGSSAAHIPG